MRSKISGTQGSNPFELAALGIILELLQWQSGYRTLELMDAALNMLGVATGWLLAATRLVDLLEWSEHRLSP